MYPHRIRLRGPWEYDALDVTKDQPSPSGRVTMPCPHWDGPPGRVRFLRRFGYPGRIDSYEHVWLTVAEVSGRADLILNGHRLAVALGGPCEFEVTPLLEPRNRLEIPLDAASGNLGEVALEVRRDAFLRGVVCRRGADDTVHVTGQVVGQCARPLELYVLADGGNVAYSLIEPRPEGKAFDVSFKPDAPPQEIRVELVHVAECWYAVESVVEAA